MRVKKIKIEIKSTIQTLEEAKETMGKIIKGEKTKKVEGLYFEDLESMRKVLTPKRLELLHKIKESNPSSLYELAKQLNRDLKNVIQDLAYLEKLGLVKLKKTLEGRGKTVPLVGYDKILLEITV